MNKFAENLPGMNLVKFDFCFYQISSLVVGDAVIMQLLYSLIDIAIYL